MTPQLSHHHASLQVFPDAAGSRVVWIADLLPHEAAPRIASMIEQGLSAMARHLAARHGPEQLVAFPVAGRSPGD